jgi:hypothetical protein
VLLSIDVSPTDSVLSYFLYMLVCFGTFHVIAWICVTICFTGFLGRLRDKWLRRSQGEERTASLRPVEL